jgi:Trypsin
MSHYARVLRRALSVAVASAIALALASTQEAHAITNGQPDGNGHPYVGVMVVQFGDDPPERLCSGELIASTYFLTAAHCLQFIANSGGFVVIDGVSFEPTYDPNAPATIVPAASFTFDPAFGKDRADLHDLGVITLAQPVAATPVKLPPTGLLDQLAPQGGLRGQDFTNVGYGATGFDFGGGRPRPADFAIARRRVSTSPFQALEGAVLRLLENTNATGEGGVCFGDSGSARLLNLAGDDVAVAIVSVHGGPCPGSASNNYRLDTPSARAFLSQFVTLP